MDRLVDGWMDGQMGRGINEWMLDGWMDRSINRWMYGWLDGRINGCMNG